jgi:hypothetical protein
MKKKGAPLNDWDAKQNDDGDLIVETYVGA